MDKINKIYNIVKEINYGYCDKNLNKYTSFTNIDNNYYLQSPEELLKTKLGLCWDQVELLRYLYDKENIENKTYFIIGFHDSFISTHTFCISKIDNIYYYIENAWVINSGIYKFNDLNDALKYVKNKFTLEFNVDFSTIFEYTKPKYGINSNEFIKYCSGGIKIDE